LLVLYFEYSSIKILNSLADNIKELRNGIFDMHTCTQFYTNQWSTVKYQGISKLFRTDAVKIIKIINKRVLKLPTSTQLRATWHTDSLDMVALQSTGASR
jgi:hypothetical protein